MSTPQTGPSRMEQANRRLLEEGAGNYLAALNALGAFQREVLQKCRTTVATHLEPMATVLDVKRIEASQITDLVWPENFRHSWEGLEAWLGVKVNVPGYGWACTYGIYWDNIETELPKISACAGIGLQKKQTQALWQAFTKTDPGRLQKTDYEIWVDVPLSAADMGTFEEKLHEAIEEWFRHWRKKGAFKAVPARDPSAV